MRFIGFILEQDANIRNARNFKDMFQPFNIAEPELTKIISYLENGVFLCGVMSFIYDNDGKAIGNLDYFTDGEFIWPSYLPYYLKKYNNFHVDGEFLEFVQKNNFEIQDINSQKLAEIEDLFDKEWSGKSPS